MSTVQVRSGSARELEVKELPERMLAVHRFRADPTKIPDQIGNAFGAVFEFAGRHGLQIRGPAVSHYTMSGQEFDVAAGFVVDDRFAAAEGVELFTLPATKVVTAIHFGPYTELPAAYESLMSRAAEMGLQLSQHEMWEEYHNEPGVVPDEELETVIYWPIVE